jgi:hypothetical protein
MAWRVCSLNSNLTGRRFSFAGLLRNLDHAGGIGWAVEKNSIAFGTLPPWTSTKVNEGSFCRTSNRMKRLGRR